MLYLAEKNYFDEMWAHAEISASMSKDPSTKTGACAARNRHIIGTGRNGFPPGIVDAPSLLNDRPSKYLLTIHAEINLIAACCDAGHTLRASDVFVTFPVCNHCMEALIAAGVSRIISVEYPENQNKPLEWYYRWQLSKLLCAYRGIVVFVRNENGDYRIAERSIFWTGDQASDLKNACDAINECLRGNYG